jgi:hypothetical protein
MAEHEAPVVGDVVVGTDHVVGEAAQLQPQARLLERSPNVCVNAMRRSGAGSIIVSP